MGGISKFIVLLTCCQIMITCKSVQTLTQILEIHNFLWNNLLILFFLILYNFLRFIKQV